MIQIRSDLRHEYAEIAGKEIYYHVPGTSSQGKYLGEFVKHVENSEVGLVWIEKDEFHYIDQFKDVRKIPVKYVDVNGLSR